MSICICGISTCKSVNSKVTSPIFISVREYISEYVRMCIRVISCQQLVTDSRDYNQHAMYTMCNNSKN